MSESLKSRFNAMSMRYMEVYVGYVFFVDKLSVYLLCTSGNASFLHVHLFMISSCRFVKIQRVDYKEHKGLEGETFLPQHYHDGYWF